MTFQQTILYFNYTFVFQFAFSANSVSANNPPFLHSYLNLRNSNEKTEMMEHFKRNSTTTDTFEKILAASAFALMAPQGSKCSKND